MNTDKCAPSGALVNAGNTDAMINLTRLREQGLGI